jgi:hypothetical protein
MRLHLEWIDWAFSFVRFDVITARYKIRVYLHTRTLVLEQKDDTLELHMTHVGRGRTEVVWNQILVQCGVTRLICVIHGKVFG